MPDALDTKSCTKSYTKSESESYDCILNELFSSTKKQHQTCQCAQFNRQCDSNDCPCFARNQCCHLGCNCKRCLNLLPKDEMKKLDTLDTETDFDIQKVKKQTKKQAKKQAKKHTQRTKSTTDSVHSKRVKRPKKNKKRAKIIKEFSNTGTQTDETRLINTR